MSDQPLFRVNCSKCAQEFAAPLAHAGQPMRCPHCDRETILPATPERSAIITYAARDPMPGPARIEAPRVVLALNVIAVLQILGCILIFISQGSLALAAGSIVSAVVTFALARLVISAHESTARLARLELLLEIAVNRPK